MYDYDRFLLGWTTLDRLPKDGRKSLSNSPCMMLVHTGLMRFPVCSRERWHRHDEVIQRDDTGSACYPRRCLAPNTSTEDFPIQKP